ncbi:MAG: SDR family oxidoreductase [Bacteroidia bacterium]|nr:SDR family oxidoreductase [Bacteroidia bacterium]NNF31633.1 SDR family oxidoreductase [Flavobacteriaceae bacterium]MBT8277308.1 SDR family oxidoreductase [Bacteroidia bacterium]NNJ81250.1 SDR family oxidoreductase [Flavobacteriaceae bacterium]NNK54729.1 SDR family oxidoreductase [Flavobacteriaceae bacterium]
MKILLTGANGYIGMRLLPLLLEQGHQVICAVRNAARLSVSRQTRSRIQVIEIDFLDDNAQGVIPGDIDAAYYLIHSMSSSTSDFDEKEEHSARNFNKYISETNCKQVIYLGGIVNEENLSKHLWSRKNVEEILKSGSFSLTVLRAAIIVGSGSASFEIIRDLCEKLPVMITPKWVKTRCQPIAIRNVIEYLTGVLGEERFYNESYDIGGPDILTYREMMKLYAKIRKLKLYIIDVPFMSPKLSSYWLYFVTSTSYKLALNLVDSMKVEVITRDTRLQEALQIDPISYAEAIKLAFKKIEQNQVLSSWKDSMVSGRFRQDLNEYIKVPKYGCLIDEQTIKITDPERVLNNIWTIGGKKGWYYGNFLWKIRGFIDKLFGGVGLRRGRTHPDKIFEGDALDFWRVILADKEQKRLLLFAEMRVPGEAWLEFDIDENNILHQTATFRPKGLWGRIYWFLMLPFHYFIFGGMIRRIAKS